MLESRLILEDDSVWTGTAFGAARPAAGELVFATGMVGYPEALTDPSFRGQILVLTYPLIGNYGVPDPTPDDLGLPQHFESDAVQVSGLVVSSVAGDTDHWSATRSLHGWLEQADVPAISGVDTRALARRLRASGTMLARLQPDGSGDLPFEDPSLRNLAAEVSVEQPVDYGSRGPRVVVVDTGVKTSIIRQLVATGVRVRRVPWNYDFLDEDFSGIVLGNGPGNPKMVKDTVDLVRRAIDGRRPVFGICLGNQILALAAGADTYKLKFGHRSQNQPCSELGTRRCYVTSQNHGYAVDGATLPEGWREWFVNANDGSNEGIRHEWKPFRSVQFHPEATPGPTDTGWLFQSFVEMLR